MPAQKVAGKQMLFVSEADLSFQETLTPYTTGLTRG
jgi:hypothetical protein